MSFITLVSRMIKCILQFVFFYGMFFLNVIGISKITPNSGVGILICGVWGFLLGWFVLSPVTNRLIKEIEEIKRG